MKKRSRIEIFSMLVLPLIAVAVRKADLKSIPMNFATTRPAESRKVKLPSLRLTRRTSGVNDWSCAGATLDSLGNSVSLGGFGGPGGADAGLGEASAGEAGPRSAAAGRAGRRMGFCSAGKAGNRHLPAAF